MSQEAIDIPFRLPDDFLWFLGCTDKGRYVGIFLSGESVGYNNGTSEEVGTLDDEWKFLDFVEELHFESWLIDRGIDLRDEDHWVIVDRITNDAIIAPRELGLKITAKQEVPSD